MDGRFPGTESQENDKIKTKVYTMQIAQNYPKSSLSIVNRGSRMEGVRSRNNSVCDFYRKKNKGGGFIYNSLLIFRGKILFKKK